MERRPAAPRPRAQRPRRPRLDHPTLVHEPPVGFYASNGSGLPVGSLDMATAGDEGLNQQRVLRTSASASWSSGPVVDVRWLEYILLLDKLLSGSELLRRPNRVFREPVGSGEQALQHPYRGCVGVGAWSSRPCRWCSPFLRRPPGGARRRDTSVTGRNSFRPTAVGPLHQLRLRKVAFTRFPSPPLHSPSFLAFDVPREMR